MRDLGDKMNVAPNTVSLLELGESGKILDRIQQFAQVCGGDVIVVVIGRGAEERLRGDLAELVNQLDGAILKPLQQHLARWLRLDESQREAADELGELIAKLDPQGRATLAEIVGYWPELTADSRGALTATARVILQRSGATAAQAEVLPIRPPGDKRR